MQEWELQLSRIENSVDRKIEDVLRVGYDRLSKKDQSLFLHIARIFNKNEVDEDPSRQISYANGRSWDGEFYWNPSSEHSLLQQLGRQIVHEQSDEPGKRQFLVEPQEIHDVLANETGTGSVIGISFDMSKMGKFSISGRAFEGMCNLRFLKMHLSNICYVNALLKKKTKSCVNEDTTLRIAEDMEYLPRLRLLHWDSYPRKRLPLTFQTEYLIEFHMKSSNLEKLWDGIQPLANLKKLDLRNSCKLKEIPNLSEATNLEKLKLDRCKRLVELPSSIKNLHKLIELTMVNCQKLRVIPTNIILASLSRVSMSDCSQLRTFPDFSSNISYLTLTHVPECVKSLDLSYSDIKKIPDCVIGLPELRILTFRNCKKLVSLQGLPRSLLYLSAHDCGSLKSVCFSFDEPIRVSSNFYDPSRNIIFENCLSLDEESRRAIIQEWAYSCLLLPCKEIPAEFTHKGKGNSITIYSGTFSASSRFKACLLLSLDVLLGAEIVCRIRSKGVLIRELDYYSTWSQLLTEHLFVFSGRLFEKHICLKADIIFEFSCREKDDKITECGVQIMADESDSSSSSKWKEHNDGAIQVFKDESVVKSSKHTNWWNRHRKKKAGPNLMRGQLLL